MNETANRELGQAPVGKLMSQFAIPCIMSLLVSALYNIVDQIFVGRGVGYLGNGATNVVFPVTVITLAFALAIGDSCAAFLSLCQGQQDTENAHHSVGNAVTLTVLVSLLLTAIFAVGRDGCLTAFGATEANRAYAVEYFTYLLPGIPFYMFGTAMNSVIRAGGSPAFAMLSTLVGCVMNVILDPIAIFALQMGMKGAALATISGQIVTALMAVWYLAKKSKAFRLKTASFHLSGHLLRRFLPLGISSFITQVSIVAIMAAMNNVLVIYGAKSPYGADIPMTVVGIVMKVFQIVVAIVVGIAAGCQPLVGYNYGAGHIDRVRQILKTMMAAEIAVGLVSLLCFQMFPRQITALFGSGDALYEAFAVMAFHTFLCTIPLCCVQKAGSIFLQSLGQPLEAMSLSLLREIVLSIPLAILLPMFFGVTGALYSAPVADVVSCTITVVILTRVMGKLKMEV